MNNHSLFHEKKNLDLQAATKQTQRRKMFVFIWD